MYKILVSDPIADKGIALLEDAEFEVIYNPNPSTDELQSYMSDIDAWIVRSGTQILSEHLVDTRKLKVIGRAGVGTDNIDIKEATNRGVIVMNMPDGNTISAAEHTIAMMMALSRNIQKGHMDLMSGEWSRKNLVGSELQGKILGVVGLGRIGREVIKRALGLEMKIIGYDPFVNEDVFDSDNIEITDLDQLTKRSDYITLHVPLIESTQNIFNLERLKMMKDSARLINVARGGIVNEKDLSIALNRGVIAGAAIDVFEKEPIDSNNPLINSQNILLTPHLGASTFEASEGVSFGICMQVKDYLIDGKLSNPLNMPVHDMGELKQIQSLLDLSEIMGKIGSQLLDGLPIESVSIECMGEIDDSKLIALSILIGLIQDMTDINVNFVNAGVIAQERGIEFIHSLSSEQSSYANLVNLKISSKKGEIELSGSSFGKNQLRIVKILGYELDFKPKGTMLFIKNKDVPGVVGKIGLLLADFKVNIGEYILSREKSNEFAYSVIKVDGVIESELIEKLTQNDEIIKINQINL